MIPRLWNPCTAFIFLCSLSRLKKKSLCFGKSNSASYEQHIESMNLNRWKRLFVSAAL